MTETCAAITWGNTDKGKDYTPCGEDAPLKYRLEGLLLAVEVHLCKKHMDYFLDQPKGWGTCCVVPVEKSESSTGISTAPRREATGC